MDTVDLLLFVRVSKNFAYLPISYLSTNSTV